jgi:hypothetical protein
MRRNFSELIEQIDELLPEDFNRELYEKHLARFRLDLGYSPPEMNGYMLQVFCGICNSCFPSPDKSPWKEISNVIYYGSPTSESDEDIGSVDSD